MAQAIDWEFGGDIPRNYARYLEPAIFDGWAADLVRLADLRPGERVLDVGCGTGVVTRYAAPRVGMSGQVIGLDASPAMLAVACALLPSTDQTVEWREASAQAMPLADATMNVVLSQQAFQFFPGKLAALREMHRVLTPDGRCF